MGGTGRSDGVLGCSVHEKILILKGFGELHLLYVRSWPVLPSEINREGYMLLVESGFSRIRGPGIKSNHEVLIVVMFLSVSSLVYGLVNTRHKHTPLMRLR